MEIYREDAMLLVTEGLKGWIPETESKIICKYRGSMLKEQIFKHINSNKLYRFRWKEYIQGDKDKIIFEYNSHIFAPVEVFKSMWAD